MLPWFLYPLSHLSFGFNYKWFWLQATNDMSHLSDGVRTAPLITGTNKNEGGGGGGGRKACLSCLLDNIKVAADNR